MREFLTSTPALLTIFKITMKQLILAALLLTLSAFSQQIASADPLTARLGEKLIPGSDGNDRLIQLGRMAKTIPLEGQQANNVQTYMITEHQEKLYRDIEPGGMYPVIILDGKKDSPFYCAKKNVDGFDVALVKGDTLQQALLLVWLQKNDTSDKSFILCSVALIKTMHECIKFNYDEPTRLSQLVIIHTKTDDEKDRAPLKKADGNLWVDNIYSLPNFTTARAFIGGYNAFVKLGKIDDPQSQANCKKIKEWAAEVELQTNRSK